MKPTATDRLLDRVLAEVMPLVENDWVGLEVRAAVERVRAEEKRKREGAAK